MTNKKLLFVVNVDWFFISHRLPIAIDAISQGFEVHLICSDTGKLGQLANLGINIHEVPFSRSGNVFLNELKTLICLRSLISVIQPDILHAVTIKPVLYSGVLSHIIPTSFKFVAAISGLGYVFSADNVKAKIIKCFVTVLYKLAFKHKFKTIIFQNKTDQDILSKVTSLKPSEKVLIKGSGVDLDLYTNTPEPLGNTIKIIMACRLLKEKGVYEFVEAAKLVKSTHPNVVFFLAGSPDIGNPNSISKNELNTWQDDGIITLLGHCDNIPQLFSESHIVTMPSYYGEGVPKALIEAAACGRPIVTTNNPGCSDAIIPEKTGILVPIKDSLSLSEALTRLIDDKNLRLYMGNNAREYAISEFDIKNVVHKHSDIYKSLLNR